MMKQRLSLAAQLNLASPFFFLSSLSVYISAFYFPFYAAEGSFLFLPLFLAQASDNCQLSISRFSWWASSSSLFLLYPLLHYGMFQLEGVSIGGRLCFCGMLVLYFNGLLIGGYSSTVLLLEKIYFFKNRGRAITCIGVVMAIVLLSTPALRFLSIYGGCMLYSPVVPLMTRSYGRQLVSLVGHAASLLFLLASAGALSFVRKKTVCLLAFLSIVLLLHSYYIVFNPGTVAASSSNFTLIKGTIPADKHPYTLFATLMDDISVLQHALTGKTWILCYPESFFPYALNLYPDFLKEVAAALGSKQGIMLGAYAQEAEGVSNCLYSITHERVDIYRKRMLLPIVEKPLVSQFDSTYFIAGKNDHRSYCIEGEALFPLVCAELYLQDCFKVGAPYAVVLNDEWCQNSFFRELMVLGAILQACCHHIQLIYVSYTHGLIIGGQGRCIPLLNAAQSDVSKKMN